MGTAPQVGWAHSVMAWELARYAKSVRLVLPELIEAEAVLSGSGLPATTPAPTGLLNARQAVAGADDEGPGRGCTATACLRIQTP